MCGLCGFVDRSAARDTETRRAVLGAMAERIRHRGPDDSGIWQDPEAGIGLGHRRLSVLDLSPEGHQPMLSRCGRYVIAFNGEIYNYRQIRAELEAAEGQIDWRGHSDTEVMLAAIARWGLRASLEHFNGMFAFALWDREERVLHLARDRLGEKPLYYGWMGGVFLFGSELKALRAHPSWRGEIDRNVLALFLRHGYVPAPYAIYQGIRKLPPGTFLSLSGAARDGHEAAPQAYWSALQVAGQGAANPRAVAPEQATDELEVLLKDAVALRMEADVPLGAFLSGGIDSSTVVALMQAQSAQAVNTFSIGFHEAGFNEAAHAAEVARHLGTHHTELYVSPREAMAVIPLLPSLYDEPFSDSSQIPTFLVSKLARQHVTVALSGDGGDEFFAGYNRYFFADGLWRGFGWLPRGARRGLAAVIGAMRPERWGGRFAGDPLQKLAGMLPAASREDLYHYLGSYWRRPERLVRGAQEPVTVRTDRARWPAFGSFIEFMMAMDMVAYLPDDILVKVDRASMGVSLEARVPLLDHRVAEFAWQLPLDLKIRDGQRKWLLRQVLYRHVPRQLIDRPKKGFAVPIGTWLRGPLRPWAEELLDEARLRREGYLDPTDIRTRWQEHLSGVCNWHEHLWHVLAFQAWLQAEAADSRVPEAP
ncbi:MAG: asparagine synthase (glutamine-hydrolyzing) [Gammaproteobacteria bacterium]|nr:asparagine synthase (glutamine-hydrolyzing) [Gammaproteobacteria bacterium]